MSGVCGVIHFDGRPVEASVLGRMAEAAAHRGPDGITQRVEGCVGLAHLTLHCTPESLRERQPLVSREDDLVLTADARVDNRDELLQRLRAKGQAVGCESTDADLILAAYRCWGTECAVQIVGDFAFAIWDGGRRRLFAARDPMAMRAFYYRVEPGRVLFASEVKQILAAPGVPARIFEPAVAAHLAGPFGRPEWTFYEGIVQLAPAHALVVDARGQRSWRYWDIDPEYRIEYANEEDYAEHFRELFTEVVRCRLRSVRPVGIMLSGGLDSGSIASTAGRLQQRGESDCPGIHAYCWAFERLPECDERHISDGIARHYGIPVTEVPADEAWPLRDYPAHGPDQDEPYIGVYQALIERTLAAARAEGMGLVLSGDRGDLTMGEAIYDYTGLMASGQWRTLLEELRLQSSWRGAPLRKLVGQYLLRPLRQSLWPRDRVTWPRERLRRVYRAVRPAAPAWPDWLRTDFAERVDLAGVIRRWESAPAVKGFARRKRYETVFTPMHMRGMVWSERSQARFGLGFADPWSDRRIASFSLAVPQRVLNTTAERKRLARRSMCGVMPEAARMAARKISPYPLNRAALTELERDTILELMTNSESGARGYVGEELLRAHFEAICLGEQDHPYFWRALTLEMWLRKHWPIARPATVTAAVSADRVAGNGRSNTAVSTNGSHPRTFSPRS